MKCIMGLICFLTLSDCSWFHSEYHWGLEGQSLPDFSPHAARQYYSIQYLFRLKRETIYRSFMKVLVGKTPFADIQNIIADQTTGRLASML